MEVAGMLASLSLLPEAVPQILLNKKDSFWINEQL
jgi:hypothetical protein